MKTTECSEDTEKNIFNSVLCVFSSLGIIKYYQTCQILINYLERLNDIFFNFRRIFRGKYEAFN